MGQITMSPGPPFLPGETVNAYLRTNWMHWQLPPAGAPLGASSGSGVVAADGSLLITGLPDDSRFFLYAATPDRYIKSTTIGQTDRELATGQGKTLLFAPVSTAASGDSTIVAAVTGRRIKLVSYVLVATTAVSVKWKSGAGTDLSGAMPLGANGIAAEAGEASSHLLETAAGAALVLNLGAAVQVSGHVSYFTE